MHEEDEDESDRVDVGFLEAEPDVLESSVSSTSLSASIIGFRSSCNFVTASTASFVPFMTPSFTLLVVSTTHVTSEKAVLNKPPNKLRLSSTGGSICSASFRRRFPDLHGSTPSVGFGSFPSKSMALGRMTVNSLVTAVT